MKTNGNDKALEAYKIFPYVAWVLVISFSYFVYNLTTELQKSVMEIQAQTQKIEQMIQVQAPSEETKTE